MHIVFRNFKFIIFLFFLSLNFNSYSHAHLSGTFISEEEAKKYAYLLGYNYQSSEWYEKSYKVFNKNYKAPKIQLKNNKNNKSLIEKIKSKIF